MAHEIGWVFGGNDSDSMEEDIESLPQAEIDKLRRANEPQKLTQEERKMLRTYTYDPEPVKAWREINDYIAIKECNGSLWSKICEKLDQKEHFQFYDSLVLYRNRHSELVHTVERILCPKRCYFFPVKCLFAHGYDFKNLLKRSLHQRFSPAFENLFASDNNKIVELERLSYGPPNLIKLADDIGINTVLEYDDEGFLQIDISVFNEHFWNDERPCFVKEEKKVLDILYALLLVSSSKHEEEIAVSSKTYSQKVQGINEPILKLMCSGPLEQIDLRDKDHWEFVHHEEQGNVVTRCGENQNKTLEGPVSTQDASVVHPCNFRKCWMPCMCVFCQHTRQMKCPNHKKHIKHNMKHCRIQEIVQCQEHWLDHPKHFDSSEDIKIDHCKIYCNGEIRKNCRNDCYKTITYTGLKKSCKKCRRDVKDHVSEHLVLHMQCKLCLYELKSSDEPNFWKKVCFICGKVFESEIDNVQHLKRHEENGHICEICNLACSNKFTLHRHMIEQHGSFQMDNTSSILQQDFPCQLCEKSYKYERNLKEHVKNSHTQKSSFRCEVCSCEFSVKSSLKVHMAAQHGITEFGSHILHKETKTFRCNTCGMVFRKSSNLKAHERTHMNSDKFTCDQCGKQFTVKTSLNRHVKVHTPIRDQYSCEICKKSFLSRGSLGRHRNGVHGL